MFSRSRDFEPLPFAKPARESIINDALIVAQEQRGAGGHFMRQFHRRRDQLVGLIDPVYQAPALGRLSVEEIPRKGELLGSAYADQARQLLAQPPSGHDSHTRMGVREFRGFRGQ